MPFWSRKIDWQNSLAHAELLSKFLKPNRLKDLYANRSWASEWKAVLGENLQTAIDRYIKNGYIVLAPLENIVDYSYKLDDLKEIARKFGVPVSGKKSELVTRLIAFDKNFFSSKLRSIVDIYICSETGRQVAENYRKFRKEERTYYEEKTLEALRQRNFSEAVRLIIEYQRKQIFPTGVDENNAPGIIKSLEFTFSARPGFLAELDETSLREIRVLAGMNTLWMDGNPARYAPEDFKLDSGIALDKICQMLNEYAFHQYRVQEILRDRKNYRGVEIHTADDSCSHCKKLRNKIFDLDHIPELPHPGCTHKFGCRCTMYPVWKM